jgi:glycerol-3-phosphate acyltransferase PlsY
MAFDSPILILPAVLGGYLLGSIPFGLVLTRLAGLGDIRQTGSGNIGATNVLRTGRKDLALATLILDSGKAGFAGLIFGALVSTPRASPQRGRPSWGTASRSG